MGHTVSAEPGSHTLHKKICSTRSSKHTFPSELGYCGWSVLSKSEHTRRIFASVALTFQCQKRNGTIEANILVFTGSKSESDRG